jgi:hypothetical protein
MFSQHEGDVGAMCEIFKEQIHSSIYGHNMLKQEKKKV